jgi:hypothetical protein
MQFTTRSASGPGLLRGSHLLLAYAAVFSALSGVAQTAPPVSSGADSASTEVLPGTGGSQQENAATLIGTVMDAAESVLGGAEVTVTALATGNKQKRVTDSNGFFSFVVAPGQYEVTVTAPGFVVWRSGTLTLTPSEFLAVPSIVLKLATAVDTVRVTATERERCLARVVRNFDHRHLQERPRRWGPNYSFVLGNLAAGGISNVYYPAADRAGAELTINNALIDTGLGAFNALVEEFALKKLTRGAPATR